MGSGIFSGAWWPHPKSYIDIMTGLGDPSGFQPSLMDAATEKVAAIIRVPKTGTLDTVGFRAGVLTLNAGSQIRISFQDVNLATGDPDGTPDQSELMAGSEFTTNSWHETGSLLDGGSARRSVTEGDLLAVVFDYDTFNSGDTLEIDKVGVSARRGWVNSNYMDLFTASWVKDQTNSPNIALKYNDGSYAHAPGTFACSSFARDAFNNTSTPDEKALKFVAPADMVVRAVHVALERDGAVDIVLYDASDVVLASVSLDPDVRAFVVQSADIVKFVASVTLVKGATYRLAIKPTTGTNVFLTEMSVNSVVIWDQMDGQQNISYSERVDAGVWTDVATKRIAAGLIIEEITGLGEIQLRL